MNIKPVKTQLHKINAICYQNVWDFQTLLHENLKHSKKLNKTFTPLVQLPDLNHLILCEHSPVYTLGKSADDSNFRLTPEQLINQGFEVVNINRGGDITYHGPGQITGYLIFDVEKLYRDLHKFVRNIEELIIETLKAFDLRGFRIPEYTGVWLGEENDLRKICAIGIHMSRWISMHGFAFNINTQLDHFSHIIPCGIDEQNKTVTSLQKELGEEIDVQEVETLLVKNAEKIFNLDIINF